MAKYLAQYFFGTINVEFRVFPVMSRDVLIGWCGIDVGSNKQQDEMFREAEPKAPAALLLINPL